MKFLVTIFSIYFLGLSFTPCEDIVHIDTDTTEVVSDFELHSDNHCEDQCSPFCSCQCCHVNMVETDLHSYKIISPQISKLSSTHFISSVQEVNYAILHPPRV
ncbi:DUF6660 family protein [Aquimarina sp. 2201CG5-10]|uniref:DUF6660 family protein n=1 Tax=Aquimarina callyspongiae TaxID=3098150 RepID=UPI002AB5A07B|nr:DUF6660 family protein [Aquimarina sp. 2201CG5-10]MDY8134618.1 DUF6660 family protein [Aquimarina sp. 2201CG5-10]